MRLSQEELFELTLVHRPAAQARWFIKKLGIEVPCDKRGPILTKAALEKLLETRLGLREVNEPASPPVRPAVKLLKNYK